MRRLLLATAAMLVVATPAAAKDNSPYVGIDAGAIFPKKQSIQGNIDFTDPTVTDFTTANIGNVKYKTGYDVDLVGGYDFGMFRLEGELGYKHAKTKSLNVNSAFVDAVNAGAGTAFTGSNSFDLDDKTRVFSAMANALLDVGGNGGIGAYAGAGAGYANVKQFGDSSGKFAWQLLAGAYMPVSENIDVGLKYRYFRAGSNNSTQAFAFTPAAGAVCGTAAAPVACSGGTAFFDNDNRFSSHSILASLTYNFAAAAAAPPPPPPPPPPAPEAPATQTCPDGSVISATSACPAPPPPPPPPPPTERGERGR
jgi:opacity protein-like surface antigen